MAHPKEPALPPVLEGVHHEYALCRVLPSDLFYSDPLRYREPVSCCLRSMPEGGPTPACKILRFARGSLSCLSRHTSRSVRVSSMHLPAQVSRSTSSANSCDLVIKNAKAAGNVLQSLSNGEIG